MFTQISYPFSREVCQGNEREETCLLAEPLGRWPKGKARG